MTKITYIPGEIANAAIDITGKRKPVTRTQHIFDDAKGKSQSEVNADIDGEIAEIKGGSTDSISTLNQKIATEQGRAQGAEQGLDNRLSTVEELAEISVGGGDIGIATAADFESDNPSDLAKVPTVGAMLGGANDGVYDISARHNGTKYADLAAALGANGANVPQSLRKGGMSVKFVQSSDNKYVQYFLTNNEWSTVVTNWQGVDDIPMPESDNLAKSGGIFLLTYKELFGLSASFNPISEDTVATRTDKATASQVVLRANNTYYIKAKGTISTFTTKNKVLYFRYEVSGSPVNIPLYSSDGQSLSDEIYLKYTPEVDGRLSVRSYTEGDSVYVAAVNVEDGIDEMLLAENYSEVGAITYNDNNAIQSYNVKWADGTSGIYTSTDWDEANNMYKGYTVTYGDSLILTQPAVTVVNGLITRVPQKTITSQI